MAFVNNFKPPRHAEIDISKLLEPGDYDVNSSIPVPNVLETERVQLVPFIPALHAEVYHAEMSKHPDLGKYLPASHPTLESFLLFHETWIRQDPDCTLFAIIDKTKTHTPSSLESQKIRNGRLAGIIGWLHGSPQNLGLEIGPVIIFPEFQRTFVSANAIGLLLKYTLDLPAQGGLGYRRVAWQANPLNEASIKAAEKLGFTREGVLRWTWVLSEGMKGKEMKGRGRGELDGRDSAILSLCWDDGEGGIRDMVLKRMERI